MGRTSGEARHAAVSRLLACHDPMGLVEIGLPEDECDPEVETIEPRLPEASSPDELRRIVCEEFARWFGEELAGPESGYAAVAEDLWSLARPAEGPRDFGGAPKADESLSRLVTPPRKTGPASHSKATS